MTDSSEPLEDWTENDPMTWYIRGNALSLADGSMNILALEGEDGFDLTGETAPVYCFAVSTCMKEWEDESYLYHSWRTRVGDGYVPMSGDAGAGQQLEAAHLAACIPRREKFRRRPDQWRRPAAHTVDKCIDSAASGPPNVGIRRAVDRL